MSGELGLTNFGLMLIFFMFFLCSVVMGLNMLDIKNLRKRIEELELIAKQARE